MRILCSWVTNDEWIGRVRVMGVIRIGFFVSAIGKIE